MDTPSKEDFEAYDRVTRWMNHAAHQSAIVFGNYIIKGDSEGVFVETDFGAEILTEELADRLNITVRKEE